MLKKLLIIGLFLSISMQVYAATENGVTVNYWIKKAEINGVMYPGSYGKDCEIFTAYQFGTETVVYNEAGGTSTIAGLLDVRAFSDERTIGFNLINVGDGTTTLYLKGAVGTTSTLVTIYTGTYSVAVSGSIPIPEYYNYVKVGGLSSSTTGNSADIFLTAIKKEH